MIAQKLMKKPILMIGILFMIIFLFQLHKKGYFDRSDKLIATSCKSALVMLDKRKPKNWETECQKNDLSVTIKFDLQKKKIKDLKIIRRVLYRELANGLIFISRNTLNENLERMYMVKVLVTSQKMEVGALTEGRFLAKLTTMKNQKLIAEHLKATVQTKEMIKK